MVYFALLVIQAEAAGMALTASFQLPVESVDMGLIASFQHQAEVADMPLTSSEAADMPLTSSEAADMPQTASFQLDPLWVKALWACFAKQGPQQSSAWGCFAFGLTALAVLLSSSAQTEAA